MRGVNSVTYSGNVGKSIKFNTTRNGHEACSFQVASDRYARGTIITTWVKINVYRSDLVRACENLLHEGGYVIVEGELMNRDSAEFRDLVEIRASSLVFVPTERKSEEWE